MQTLRLIRYLLCSILLVFIIHGGGVCQPDISDSDSIRLDTLALQYKKDGVTFYNNNQLDSAIYLTKKALAIWESIGQMNGQANAYQNLGSFFVDRFQLDSSIIYYEKIFDVVPPHDSFAQNAFLFIGENYERLNNIVKARDYYLRGAMAAFEAENMNDYVYLHDIYAKTYSDFDRDRALELLHKTEPIYQELINKYPLHPVVHDFANNLNAQGVLFEHLNNFEKALNYYSRSFQILEDYYLRRTKREAIKKELHEDYYIAKFLFLNNSINAFTELKRLEKVRENQVKAEEILAVIRDSFPQEYSRWTTNYLLTLAHVAETQNRFFELDSLFKEIFTILIPDYQVNLNNFYPKPSQILASEHKETLFDVMVKWCGYWDSNQLNADLIFEKTIPMYALIDRLVDQILESQDSRKAMHFWRTVILPLYQSAFEIAAAQEDLGTAFYYAEKSKALGLLSEVIAARSYNQLDTLAKKKIDCKHIIDSLELELNKPGISNNQEEKLKAFLQRTLQFCNPLFFQKSKGIYQSLSDYIFTFSDVQAQLGFDQAAIEYFDTRKSHYGILITQDTILLRHLPELQNRDSVVNQLIDNIYQVGYVAANTTVETKKLLSLLYQHLIQPFHLMSHY